MYSMIRHVSSKEELEVKISACIAKYGHNKNSLNYINSLAGIKKHLCRPYTQGLFTLRHTATQRSEGFNDKIKGHASLQDMLSDADLVTLHDHMDTLNRSNDKRAMDELAKLLNKMMRWSTRFESAVQESICLSTNVESCDDIGNGCFRVTQRDNTETKIIHLGQLYTIPTCDCGFWTSFFILCLCIVRALRVSPKGSLSDAFDVSNVHPFHRIEVHPMWKEALCKVKRADYEKREPHGSDNIDQVNSMVQAGWNDNGCASSAYPPPPDKYFDMKIPKKSKNPHPILGDACNKLKKLAIDNSDESTYKLAMARVRMATDEISQIISNKQKTPSQAIVDSLTKGVPLPPHMPL